MTYNQAQKIAENRNGRSDDPSYDPETQTDADPRADGNPVALVHAVCSTEDTDVDVLECDVTVDDTGDDDLVMLVI